MQLPNIMEIVEKKFENLSYKYLRTGRNNHTLLFLHGFTGTSSVWDNYVELLKNKFDILLVDLAGHGESESPKTIEEFYFQNQAETIIRTLHNLEIGSVSVISYSFSCYIALLIKTGLKGKVKNMVFVSPFFKEKFGFSDRLIFGFIKLIWRYLIPNKKFKLDYSKLKNYENPSFRDTEYTLKCINTKDVLGSIYSLANCEEVPELASLKIPLLIIYGENDKMLSDKTKSLLQKLEMAEIKMIKNKKHLFLRTEVPKIAERMESFLIRHSPVFPR